MKVEVLTTFKHEGSPFEEGDIRTVADEVGEYFCRAGWTKDLAGKVKTEAPEKGDIVLMVQDINQNNVVGTANG